YHVSKPFTDFQMYPIDCSKKCFDTYCPCLKKLVLLKDIWRKMEYEKEGDMLCKLNVANFPNIPTILDNCDIDGDFQKIKVPYRQAMQHYVQDALFVPSFRSSWEMVNVTPFENTAHEAAWESTNILHPDISSGNILIYDPPSTPDGELVESRGLLIDWEMAKVEHQMMQGTHPFIAPEPLSPDHIQHKPRHDLELFLYVLLWITSMKNPS
ncbi:hypothetical protein BT69DRAFT_1199594, partial [Atractiella rhizophila]